MQEGLGIRLVSWRNYGLSRMDCNCAYKFMLNLLLDAKAIVDAFNSQTYSNTIVSSIMDDCMHMATRIPQTSFRHIYREANKCTDFLAKLGILIESDFIVFFNPLVDLSSILEVDANGLYVSRLCPEPLFAV